MQLKKDFFQSRDSVAYLGTGEVGGKAGGLEFIHAVLTTQLDPDQFPEFEVSIPRMIVIRTDVFDDFMDQNDLWLTALSDKSNEKIAQAFQQADLPFPILGDLRQIVTEIKDPLAIRSSSLLEDTMHEPFAGVYRTKMTPNNQADVDARFRKLVEAIKFVYASTFFKSAKNYLRVTKHREDQEKMAVIIQEVVGKRQNGRYYPEISGVACSYNFYPAPGADPKKGVVSLALGLGKTIVDGGTAWSYSPAAPQKDPPFKSTAHMLRETQLQFWAVNVGPPAAYDPLRETEYLFEHHFTEAQKDGVLDKLVSTYDPQSERILIGQRKGGALILNFAPILKVPGIPLNGLISTLMQISEEAWQIPVEIEFAVTLSADTTQDRHRFGFLQVRPLLVSAGRVDLPEKELHGERVIIATDMVMGNGQIDEIRDIVFLKPKSFDSRQAALIAGELEKINRSLVDADRPYVLIGYGRWGTTDPWAGIPVDWSQISGAKVIVEAANEELNQDMSQGSHFFHNVTSFQVFYFSIPYPVRFVFNMDWIDQLPAVTEKDFVKHVVADPPLTIKADGKTGRGVILKNTRSVTADL